MRFKIDFFELMFLAEACTPRRPIARAMFWLRFCDEIYHDLTEGERKKAFEWLKPKLDLEEEDSQLFLARFDPNNQYQVTAKGPNTKEEVFNAFLWKDRYYTCKNKSVYEPYVLKVEKI